ncbi:MAG: CDP-glycerol glycerophosphotransferase family protein [Clostridiales bacterium]|nr:CDP-glycerol glycerophosphotransferase family protein [Clostridiales bacterium]
MKKVISGRIDGEWLSEFNQCLLNAENAIDSINIRLQVVFLPYMASMWDSMESIWFAARDDPNCDAYVIPIPYFHKLPDGSLRRRKYEGNIFPDYVPITDYGDYIIHEKHPDIIYFHNPYDLSNTLTSVHPDFYSARLKTQTDLLVYVPYFISVDKVDENYCLCPGPMNSDLVVLESEAIRKTYLSAVKSEQNKEQKYVALGSPKFDKVLNTKSANCAVPDEWKEIIEKPGGRRRAVLYNTNIGGLLHDNEALFPKLRWIFDSFSAQEDVVIIWRPHPLNIIAYASMRPALLGEYKQIVEEYKSNRIGIFDDSPDLNRAIALADAYYGDLGSVPYLFLCIGKPVLIQNEIIRPEPGTLPDMPYEYPFYNKDYISSLSRLDKCAIKESKYTLPDFLKYIARCDNPSVNPRADKQRELFKKIVSGSDGSAGASIYNHCVQSVLFKG